MKGKVPLLSLPVTKVMGPRALEPELLPLLLPLEPQPATSTAAPITESAVTATFERINVSFRKN
ncbi:MAG: hypothetical protein ACR2N4_08845 [Jatrophihabitans sp.]